MRSVALFVCLGVFWAVNSGQTYPFLIGCGVVCCAFSTWVGRAMGSFDDESNPLFRLPKMIGYLFWLLWQIILSNIDVVKRVWSPSLPIEPTVFTVPCRLKSCYMVMAYANSITLTPGTVTVEAEKDEFLIHALSSTSADDLKSGEMERRLLKVEGTPLPGAGGASDV